MSDMIERVAKAMAVADSGPLGSMLFNIHWEEFGPGYLDSARIALKAIREITPQEKLPGVKAYVRRDTHCRPVALLEAWQAIIDAALSQDTNSLPTTPGAVNAGIGAPPPSDAGTLSEAE